MALKIQYNKTYMQQLRRELAVRENALPTLQTKEAALRLEVKRARQEVAAIERTLSERRAAVTPTHRLWREFPRDLVRVRRVDIETRKIAGVRTPAVTAVHFEVAPHSIVGQPAWVEAGIAIVRELVELHIRREIAEQKVRILERARRKTTQKVNLYEKVQIPEYREALLKIKRFLEDEENLSKSSQKILKAKIAAEAA